MIDPQQILAIFLNGPAATFLAIAFGFMALSLPFSVLTRKRRRKQRPARGDTPAKDPDSWKLSDPTVQRDAIGKAEFAPQPMLNKEELKLLPVLDQTVAGTGHRVVIQTSLAEVISARSGSADIRRRAHASINSKRLDFGIVDRTGILKVAIEYQGSGHYDANSFMRDAVKREALRKAGIPMMEIRKDFSAEIVRAEILTHLTPQAPRPPGPSAFETGKRSA